MNTLLGSIGGRPLPILLGLGLLSMGITASQVDAQAISGSGILKGNGSLVVQRCGQAGLHTRAQVVIAPDGTWMASSEDGASFSGTSVVVGTRQLDMSFDASSEAGFLGSMAGDAAELCHSGIQVTSVLKKKFLLTINRRGTRAKLVLKYTATGIANGRSGWARSGFTIRGPWTPG